LAAREETLELRIQRWPFVQLPSKLLIDNLISDGAKVTFATLQLWAGIDGRAFTNRMRLAEARGVNRATLYRHLGELEEAGWVERSTEVLAPGQLRHVIWAWREPRSQKCDRGGGVAPVRPGGSRQCDPGGRANATPDGTSNGPEAAPLVGSGPAADGSKDNLEREPGKTTPSSSAGADGSNGTGKRRKRKKAKPRGTWTPTREEQAAFDRWWEHVPRKVGKGQALVTWVKCYRGCGGETQTIKLPDDEEALHRATKQWARVAQERGEIQFCKHPSTWLNAAGWEDQDAFAEVDTGPTPEEMERRRLQAKETERRRYLAQMQRAGVTLDPDTLEVIDWGPQGPPQDR